MEPDEVHVIYNLIQWRTNFPPAIMKDAIQLIKCYAKSLKIVDLE